MLGAIIGDISGSRFQWYKILCLKQFAFSWNVLQMG